MTRILLAGVTALSLLLTQSALAGDKTSDREQNIHRASQINGKYVKNGEGDNAESLGHVSDMVVNMRDGKIVYVALSHGSTLGIGGKLFAMAPSAFRMSNDGDYLILNGVSNDTLDKAEGFDQNAWPNQPDQRWSKNKGDVQKTVEKAGQEVKDAVTGGKGDMQRLARVTSIIGMAVRTPENKSLGSVYDLAMDCNSHKVAYAAVNYGATLGIGGKLIAVPWAKMQLRSLTEQPNSNVFVINTTDDQFNNAPSFNSDHWPTQADQKFWTRIKSNDNERRDTNNRD